MAKKTEIVFFLPTLLKISSGTASKAGALF
jgi:hypothetical protein